MNLMNALLATYDFALKNDLVDNHKLSTNGQVLLPIYHSNKRNNGEDIFEITIDEQSNAIGGRFLEKDQYIVFPITEDSITRSGSKKAPHAICDELSYLAKNIDKEKNKIFQENIEKLIIFEKDNPNDNFRIIGKYLKKNSVLEDFIEHYIGRKEYSIDKKFNLKYAIEDPNGKVRQKILDLTKIFVTFKIQKLMEADISFTKDIDIHNFYIEYIKEKNRLGEQLEYCDITGKLDYCIERHRGVVGNAKLISISNNNETYYGRFKKGNEVNHISYEASQKVHNMLKFLLDNDNYKRFIGEGAYIINWLSQDLARGGVELVSSVDDEDDYEEDEEITMSTLGGGLSKNLNNYFLGNINEFETYDDFHVLIIEKISNGRMSIKYFRSLSRSEAYNRVKDWYQSTQWDFKGTKRSPSIHEITNFIYGLENSKGYLSCENKKLSKKTVERLIPCIIDGKKIPRDVVRTAFYRLSNKISYKNTWASALSIGCSMINKGKIDYEGDDYNFRKLSGVKQLKSNRSFCYGKLAAIYEKIEMDVIRGRQSGDVKGQRITNIDKFWTSMIRTPERTRFMLEEKIRPYLNMLKRSNIKTYTFYDKLIQNITMELLNMGELEDNKKGSVDEDFILGYYYQKSELYKGKGVAEQGNGEKD